MAKRLFLAAVMATALACKGTTSQTSGSTARGTASTASKASDRDAIERGLEELWDGRVLRLDLNQSGYAKDKKGKKARIVLHRAHLLGESVILEGSGDKPNLYSLRREGLDPRWVSELPEPSEFPASENPDTAVFVTRHYAIAFSSDTGRRSMIYTSGALEGLARPPLLLPFTPTGSAAAQSDTMYIASLGSPDNNKNLEAFSLVNGARGWGYRARGHLLTSPVVSGDIGDPKLYFVTDSGVVTCVDATNYADAPRSDRWVADLESGVDHDLFVTADTRRDVGGVFLVDQQGMVYCIDRITGVRRWTHATEKAPTGGPVVFGDICAVPLRGGWSGFHKDGVRYVLTVKSGPDEGKTFHVFPGKVTTVGSGANSDIRLSDGRVSAGHFTLEIQGEALVAMATGAMKVDGVGAPRASLHSGQEIAVGGTVLEVTDPGTAPLWSDLKADGFVGRIGENLVARKGSTLTLVHAYTGEARKSVDLKGARLFPANHGDSNLFVVGGDAVVYALYPR